MSNRKYNGTDANDPSPSADVGGAKKHGAITTLG